ncbi:BamA/TamA family outer membrane protein [Sulfurimonas sp.]|uniref:BamA/TamA family outer membrane protein n=1 Tax=Sulfurimonas sp. TaxID=2022749 RepID=UPI00262D4130|nr:BamA/TamA family outer membrane protein [Sulfurimonas sp.]
MKIKQILFLLLLTSNLFAESYLLYFQGNKHLSERELYEALDIYKPYAYEFYKAEPTINPKILSIAIDTLKDFYKSHGFYHAQITSHIKNKSVTLDINESVPIKISKIIINSSLDINDTIPFQVGDIFDAQKFIQSKKDLRFTYEDKGYCNAEYETKAYIDIEKNSAKIIYKIEPNNICFFRNIEIFSPKNIHKDIISSLLYIKTNEPYTHESVDKSYRNLYAYDGISQALIDTVIYNKYDVNATVKVKETKKPIRFQMGLGISSDEGPSASVGIKHRNFLGNLKTIALTTKVTKIKQSVKLDFTMPMINFNMFGSQISVENEDFFGFKESRVLAKGFLRQRDETNIFQESLIIDTSKTYDSSNLALFPQSNLLLISPELIWRYNTRDKILDPTKGYFLNTLLQGSVLGNYSDATYYKLDVTGGYILPLEPSIAAFKVRVGSLHTYEGAVPPSYRFFAGGMNSNRAYGYRLLGPKNDNNDPVGFNSIIETTAEYRFHIYDDFNGVIFNDNTFIGQNYIPDNTVGYYSTGFGLRYKTPIGPLAIDFGFDPLRPLEQHALHFHIGELF